MTGEETRGQTTFFQLEANVISSVVLIQAQILTFSCQVFEFELIATS